MEQLLQESEEKFRALVETTDEWIWAIDQEGRITYSNPAVEKILGYRPEELVGRNSFDLMHDEDRTQAYDLWPYYVNAKRGWRDYTLRWRHKDGGYRSTESNGVPLLDARGDVIGFRGADRDVTERLKSQAVERQRQHAASQLEGIRLVGREIAYLFNNDLAPAVGALELLSERVALPAALATLVQDGREHLHQAAEHINLLHRVVRVETKETTVGRSLDLVRSTDPSEE